MGPFKIVIRDVNENSVGQLGSYQSAIFIPRWTSVGTFTIKCAAETPGATDLATAGAGIRVKLPDGTDFTGIVTSIEDSWDSDTDGNGEGNLTISGIEDLAILGFRIILPDPKSGYNLQTAAAAYKATGPLETVIKNLVQVNAGSSAIGSRFVQNLVVSPSLARGVAVAVTSRYDNLLDTCQKLAVPHGMGLSLKAGSDGNYRFDIQESIDASLDVTFSRARGNVSSYKFTRTAPSATRAVVGAAGVGTARSVHAYDGDQVTWGFLKEEFVDQRQTSDIDDITQAGTDAVAAGAEQFGLSLGIIDTPDTRLGVDYGLGYKVTAKIKGVSYTDIITEVKYSDDGGQRRIAPTIGGAEAMYGPMINTRKIVKALSTRIALLERRQ